MKNLAAGAAVAVAAAAVVSCTSGSVASTEASVSIEKKDKVLVVVDVQRDFFDPSGSLYVGGSEALPEKIAAIADEYDAIVFTLDWHPGNHCSFAEQGGIWPSHCVAYTQGAGLPDCFSPILAKGENYVQLFFKGNVQSEEQYGAFEELAEDSVIMAWLKNADSVDVCGIAGDYCVKESTANLLKIVPAEKVTMLLDCIRSIDDGSTLNAFVEENSLKTK